MSLRDTITKQNLKPFPRRPTTLVMSAQFDASSARTTIPAYAGQPGDIAVSEIERLQLTHDFSRWLPHLIFLAGIGLAFVAGSIGNWICGSLIALAAFVPVYVWARRLVLGLPILPIVAVLYFVFYGLPFFTGHPFTKDYSFDDKLTAAATVAAVLLITAGLWFWLARVRPQGVTKIKAIPQSAANPFFIYGLGLACLFQLNALFGFVGISSEIFGILRAILASLGMISLFALSYQLGAGRLQQAGRLAFIGGLIAFTFLNIVTLYLIIAMEILLLSVFGYFLGGGKVPWKLIACGVMAFTVLSAGKKEIRVDYWSEGNLSVTSLSQSVTIVEQWIGYGIENLFGTSIADEPTGSFLERASITQLVLKVETETPEVVPFLDGSTYFAIPALLVPRIIWPERPSTQDTLKQLSQHYGLLSAEDAESTSIGWGLIAEAYANFGFSGCIALGIFLGLTMGFAQRWCGRAPILTARGLFGLLMIMVMFRVETNAAVTVSAWLQSMVPLIIVTMTKMQDVDVLL